MDFLSMLHPNTTLVPARGDINSDIALVGEAPGADEKAAGEPFVGRSGTLLRRLMMNVGIPPGLIYMTLVIKERPKGNDIKSFFTGKTFTEKAQPYIASLQKELTDFTGNVIVAVGSTALYALTGQTSIAKYRGSILPCTLIPGKKVVAMYHPSAALRQYILRYLIMQDLKKVKSQSTFPEIIYPSRNMIINPKFHECMAWLENYHSNGVKHMCLDIEITGKLELACIGFSYDSKEAICIPIQHFKEVKQEADMALEIARIVSDPTITKIGQNVAFDLMFLLRRYNIIPRGRIEDTMIAQGVMFHELPKGLDTLCSIYTDEPYYKDEGKEWRVVGDWNKFWLYNCKDAATTMEIWETLEKMLNEQNFKETYEMDVRKHHPLFFAMARGMPADPTGIATTKKDIQDQIDDIQDKLDNIILTKFPTTKERTVDGITGAIGYLNVNSTPQMKEYFYDQLGIPPYLKKKKPTLDDKALARLVKGTATRDPLPEAKYIQELRGLKKFRGTYLSMTFDKDNRFRCSYHPRGTYTGRLSSSQTIFHTGMNMQNLPSAFKHFLHADPGCILVEFDGVQAEWVCTAYISGDREMIRVVESGADPHTTTASFITGVEPSFIKIEDKIVGHSNDPNFLDQKRRKLCEENPSYVKHYQSALFVPRTMGMRQCGKKSNHGFNYGMGPITFALNNEISNADAEMAHRTYHKAYPGLSNWYLYVQDQLAKTKILVNPFGRKARFLDRWGPDLFMAAYAFLPQSTSADRIIDSMLLTYEREQTNAPESSFLKYAELLGQIHDSIIYQFSLSAGIEAFHKFCFYIRDLIQRPITYEGRTFKIMAECTVGFNWGDMKKISLDDKFLSEYKFILENKKGF